jgi:hypothetical protein
MVGHRRRIVLTLLFSPLQATAQTPMTLPRNAAQAAALPRRRGRESAPAAGRLRLRLHGRGLRVRRRAAAPAAVPAWIVAAAPPAPQQPARSRTPLPARPLNYAWNATFHCDIRPKGLEKWPEDGPHTFNTSESKWLAETLCYFKRSAGRPARSSTVCRALETAPPPPAKAAPVTRGSRKDEEVKEASRKRGASAPVKAKKRFAYCTEFAPVIFYACYVHYFSYVNHVYCNILHILG